MMFNWRAAIFDPPADIQDAGLTYEWKRNGNRERLAQTVNSITGTSGVQDVHCTDPHPRNGTLLATAYPDARIGPPSRTEPGNAGIYVLKIAAPNLQNS